jgi:hypothetical protein
MAKGKDENDYNRSAWGNVEIEQISERGLVVAVNGRIVSPVYQSVGGARRCANMIRTALAAAQEQHRLTMWQRLRQVFRV